MSRRKVPIIFLCLLVLLAQTGCEPKPTAPQNLLTETITQEQAAITQAHTLTAVPATRTWTPFPTRVAPTLTPSPTPAAITPTFLPTLSKAERQAYLTERISDNSDCKLPCWLGIQPGITTWQEARFLLVHLGIKTGEVPMKDGSITHPTGGFDFEKPHIYHSISFIEQNEFVRGIHLIVEGYKDPVEFQKLWKLYSPKSIMQTYGSPSRVWLSTYSSELGPEHGYDLIVAYDELGIIIQYDGSLTRNGTNFSICPRFEQGIDIQYIDIYLQSPDDPKPLEGPGTLRNPTLISKNSKRIKEASGLTEEEFSTLFTQNKEPACFNSPVHIWPEFLTQ